MEKDQNERFKRDKAEWLVGRGGKKEAALQGVEVERGALCDPHSLPLFSLSLSLSPPPLSSAWLTKWENKGLKKEVVSDYCCCHFRFSPPSGWLIIFLRSLGARM